MTTKLARSVAVLALCASGAAVAQEATLDASAADTRPNELWLDTGFATYHFQSDKDLNGRNPGVGLEYRFHRDAAVTVGRFYNSDRQHSRYAGVYYQPWQYAGVRFGAVIGGFDGYPKMNDGGWFAAIVPVATWEYKRVGVNVAVVPTYKERLHGGISMQLKFKLFE
ncbi:MAG: hypothetical protein ACLGI6_01080 [Gammaproteobacteria bacterium]